MSTGGWLQKWQKPHTHPLKLLIFTGLLCGLLSWSKKFLWSQQLHLSTSSFLITVCFSVWIQRLYDLKGFKLSEEVSIPELKVFWCFRRAAGKGRDMQTTSAATYVKVEVHVSERFEGCVRERSSPAVLLQSWWKMIWAWRQRGEQRGGRCISGLIQCVWALDCEVMGGSLFFAPNQSKIFPNTPLVPGELTSLCGGNLFVSSARSERRML